MLKEFVPSDDLIQKSISCAHDMIENQDLDVVFVLVGDTLVKLEAFKDGKCSK